MVFIVRGKMESISPDGSKAQFHDGDVCGEELLTRYLEHSLVNRVIASLLIWSNRRPSRTLDGFLIRRFLEAEDDS
ncbi:hypothetical protein PVAP13_5NG141600 [Panicum virgatum]|uniref:Cyclic nucleotide-binding domain-containing protein n=1 Tax=Panicum virgatum TaxID=38727 RepID=A0A8T0RN90_PANVG|nr:hypothetical protein PVAP13_5NG141600 [Panicum virgatum]